MRNGTKLEPLDGGELNQLHDLADKTRQSSETVKVPRALFVRLLHTAYDPSHQEEVTHVAP